MSNDTEIGYRRNVAYWCSFIRAGNDRFRTDLTDPAVLAACGDVEGLVVLDAGCGEGYMARRFLADGAAGVAGVDLDPDFVQAAKGAGPEEIVYTHASAAATDWPDETFDLIVANHLLNDVDDPAPVFAEFARLLRPAGRVVALFLHPCFYGASKGVDGPAGSPAGGYFTARPSVQGFNVAGRESPGQVLAWYRPLEDYTAAVTGAGLAITSLSEPHPSPEVLASDPWWAEKFQRPMFMLLEAVRL